MMFFLSTNKECTSVVLLIDLHLRVKVFHIFKIKVKMPSFYATLLYNCKNYWYVFCILEMRDYINSLLCTCCFCLEMLVYTGMHFNTQYLKCVNVLNYVATGFKY